MTKARAVKPGHASSRNDRAIFNAWRSVLALGIGLMLASALIWPIAYRLAGSPGVVSAIQAGLVCFGSGAAAVLMLHTKLFRSNPLAGLMATMMVRMFVPLSVCLVIAVSAADLSWQTFVFALLGYYGVALAIDTWLSVQLVSTQSSSPESERCMANGL